MNSRLLFKPVIPRSPLHSQFISLLQNPNSLAEQKYNDKLSYLKFPNLKFPTVLFRAYFAKQSTSIAYSSPTHHSTNDHHCQFRHTLPKNINILKIIKQRKQKQRLQHHLSLHQGNLQVSSVRAIKPLFGVCRIEFA